jgi:integrase
MSQQCNKLQKVVNLKDHLKRRRLADEQTEERATLFGSLSRWVLAMAFAGRVQPADVGSANFGLLPVAPCPLGTRKHRGHLPQNSRLHNSGWITAYSSKLTRVRIRPCLIAFAIGIETMAKLLQRIVTLLGSSTAAAAFPWSRLDYAVTIQLRQALVSRYAPATANLALCALRGVLLEAWRLGQISYEDFKRAGDLARVRGDRTRPRKNVETGKIEKLLAVTEDDQTIRGRRDLAILSILYRAGLRRAELTHLDMSNIDGSRLMVFGKGRRWRTTQLGRDALTALKSWIEVRGTLARSIVHFDPSLGGYSTSTTLDRGGRSHRHPAGTGRRDRGAASTRPPASSRDPFARNRGRCPARSKDSGASLRSHDSDL